jgi:thiol-disulfide isomerase/thioredoxin
VKTKNSVALATGAQIVALAWRSRRALGVAVMMGVVVIATVWDANLRTKLFFVNTAKAGEHLIPAFHSEKPAVLAQSAATSQPALADEGPLPDLGGAIGWLNSAPLDRKALRGKVVLVDIWTYTCIYSLRPLPYVKSWAAKYKDAGLVVIGVHTPEFSFEKERVNVENAVRDLKVTYPVAIDSNYSIWQAFNNKYWPAQYLIDGEGRIRYHHFGESEYEEIERVIQELLKENGASRLDGTTGSISASGVEAAPSGNAQSPETYIGYRHAERFASPEQLAQDSQKIYSPPARPSLNEWGLSGSWNVGAESAVLQTVPGNIVFRFHARDLHLILAPTKDGRPVRFRVKLDGAAPSDDRGADSSPDGTGEIREPRLYQLIRQKGPVKDRTFEIEFLDPGVQALDFTFG